MGRKKKEITELPGTPIDVKELPDFFPIDEFKVIARESEVATIVDAEEYLYFCMVPTFEEIKFCRIYLDDKVDVFIVVNFKNNPIGYLVYFVKLPVSYRASEFGSSLFFSNHKEYGELDILFKDAKFRLLGFDNRAYFASVKWKSTNPVSGGKYAF